MISPPVVVICPFCAIPPAAQLPVSRKNVSLPRCKQSGMSQRFTYSIPPHTLPFLATASHICVAEPRPHTLPFPATADRICGTVFPVYTRVSARTQTPPCPHEDIWAIDEEGRIVNHDKSYPKKDVVYRVDKEGKRVDGRSITLDYRTIEKQKSISYSPDGKTVDTYDMYQVRGDENGKKFFEFMAEAVSDAGMEVTHIQCGVEGEKGLNFITCAH